MASRRIKSLLVSTSSRPGGADRSLGVLLRALSKQGVECGLVHAGGMAHARQSMFSGGRFRTCAFEPRRRPGLVFGAWLLARWIWCTCVLMVAILCFLPDVIHANTTPAYLVSLIPGWITRRPIVWHVRDMVPLGSWGQRLGRRAAVVIAVSRAVRNHLLAQGVPENKIRVIYNAVDSDWASRVCVDDSQSCVRGLGFPHDAFIYLNVGQYVAWKKQDMFLRAAAEVVHRCPKSRFLIVGGTPSAGDPGCKQELVNLAHRLGLSECAVLLDWRDDIGHIMAGCDVLVHTASSEPFGRVLIEAMAVGLPVVSVKGGGPLDIIEHGHSGILIESDDVWAMADSMLRVQEDGVWAKRLAKAGKDRVHKEFTAEQNAMYVRQVYEGILGRA